MRKHLLFACFFVLAFFLSGCTTKPAKTQADYFTTLQVGGDTLQVAVMRTPAELTKGLSGRDNIPGDGMLFLLPERQEAQFWMKQMRFAIDMVWIDGNKIVGVREDVPPPSLGQSPDSLPVIRSDQPVTAVLELPAGDFRRRNWATGATVLLE